MKSFFTALAANLVTVAICVVAGILLILGIAASAGRSAAPLVSAGSILVIDLDRPLSDRPAKAPTTSFLEDALAQDSRTIPLHAALTAVRAAGDDDHVSGILLRGSVADDGTRSGFAALRELRQALEAFRRTSKKPVHAYLVTPDVRTYYVASAASTVTLDPFGTLMMPGLASEQVFFTGLLEQWGIGVQVSRVGRFKAAVEPFTRGTMSPENRVQTTSYLGDLWSVVKSGIATTRGVDTVALQALVDSAGLITPTQAQAAKLVDRVGYFDAVLTDLERIAGVATGGKRASDSDSLQTVPQVSLQDYASIAATKERVFTASQVVAVLYAEGDIVDGDGTDGQIGGTAFAREVRRMRRDPKVKAAVVRINSPGGSAIAAETMHRELTLLAKEKPLVISMGSLAASGGYWIATAGRPVFAEPNTLTGSIGVFSLIPNVQTLANRHGVTFDTVKTGRYADLLSLTRPRTAREMAVLQRGTDMVYDAFIDRVATARKLSPDSVRAIAEGRVWSGRAAQQIGLVDSMGGLDTAIVTAARLAKITGSYDVREYPRARTAMERVEEYLGGKSAPIADRGAATRAISAALSGATPLPPGAGLTALGLTGPAARLASDLGRELQVLLSWNDPRGVYARMPFILRVR